MLDKLPSLPTDNLYKLGTISGMVLILASLVGPVFATYLASERSVQITEDAKQKSEAMLDRSASYRNNLLEHERALTADTQKVIANLLQLYDEQTQAGNDPAKKKAVDLKVDMTIRLAKAQERQSSIAGERLSKAGDVSLARESELITYFRDEASSRLQTLRLVVRGVWGVSSCCLCMGLLLFLKSVRAWYKHHQKYQDELLREEVRKAKAEAEMVEIELAAKREEAKAKAAVVTTPDCPATLTPEPEGLPLGPPAA